MIALHGAHRGGQEKRHFMRHPTTMTMACRSLGHPETTRNRLRDASLSGLSFVSDCLFADGELLDVTFPGRVATATFKVLVVWRQDLPGDRARRHAYGARFCDQEMFPRARLLEQICHIEAYRATQAEQCDRHLSSNQAAAEWIRKYAGRFAPLPGEPSVGLHPMAAGGTVA